MTDEQPTNGDEPIVPPPADPIYRWYVTSGNGKIMADLPDMDNAIGYVTEAGYDQYSAPVVQLTVYLGEADQPAVPRPRYHILRLEPGQLGSDGSPLEIDPDSK